MNNTLSDTNCTISSGDNNAIISASDMPILASESITSAARDKGNAPEISHTAANTDKENGPASSQTARTGLIPGTAVAIVLIVLLGVVIVLVVIVLVVKIR